ncbi:MAG TPA: M55 family metallopeptidase [Gemmatimonadales bacterium]|nr:M55 family metallopeptidase [Gemmatimonadales bacterium]
MRPSLLSGAVALLSLTATVARAQEPLPGWDKTIPAQQGYRVYLLVDMEGMGSAVKSQEVIAGNEGPAYRDRTGPDYWDHYREMLTAETNAAIRGAREAGARAFVVNEGHGGNRFANLLPWALDQEAILIRGYPRPMVMSTGIDSTFSTMMMLAMHASPARRGVMAHNYAFASFSVNGTALNEVGINALVAGEMGVPVSLVSGDDELEREVRELLGDRVVFVTVKVALGSSAAITHSPTAVQRMLAEGAREAVRRTQAGEIRPFTLRKPYRAEFTLRPSYPDSVIAGIDRLASEWGVEKTGARSYRYTTSEARRLSWLLDQVERVVLP